MSESGDATTTNSNTEHAATTTAPPKASADTAVAAEWNVLRARLFDAVAVGRAGNTGTAASLAQGIFADFEGMGGEHGAHESLEHTSESAYEGFETGLGDLKESLAEGDIEGLPTRPKVRARNSLPRRRSSSGAPPHRR
ncbi:DUF5059 domain-containing protein [Haloarculaceae archaeon H-GB11]|nr:DUF5059 domain-containing protein [Haloarculaceae archaeon H-GB11]